jgi:hypothetical protein
MFFIGLKEATPVVGNTDDKQAVSDRYFTEATRVVQGLRLLHNLGGRHN